MNKYRNGFTMIELVFVVVIIGILSAVAIPKFAATRGEAEIAKAKTQVASIRSALATERQKRILRGDFTPVYNLNFNATPGTAIFDFFDGNNTVRILEYAPISCATATEEGCWRETTVGTNAVDGVYTYNMPVSGTAVFTLSNNRFDCPVADANCQLLTQ